MSHAASESSPLLDKAKLHFVLRRLHSLTGIVPIGMFLMFHLFTNAQIMAEPLGMGDKFQHEVDWIHGTIPALVFVEVFGLWLPIGFHAVLGLWYTFGGKYNKSYNKYNGNWRYLLQRITGILALIFVVAHVATLRWRWDLLGWFTPFYVDASGAHHGAPPVVVNQAGDALPLATASTAMALENTFVMLLYLIGVLSAVFHWSNGLWTAAISWGITTSEQAQKRWGHVCLGVFVAFSICTVLAIAGARAYEPTPAEAKAMEMLKAGEHPETPLVADREGNLVQDSASIADALNNAEADAKEATGH